MTGNCQLFLVVQGWENMICWLLLLENKTQKITTLNYWKTLPVQVLNSESLESQDNMKIILGLSTSKKNGPFGSFGFVTLAFSCQTVVKYLKIMQQERMKFVTRWSIKNTWPLQGYRRFLTEVLLWSSVRSISEPCLYIGEIAMYVRSSLENRGQIGHPPQRVFYCDADQNCVF